MTEPVPDRQKEMDRAQVPSHGDNTTKYRRDRMSFLARSSIARDRRGGASLDHCLRRINERPASTLCGRGPAYVSLA